MSRWLQNVTSVLEKLDGQAERVAEEQLVGDGDSDDGDFLPGDDDAAIENILAARGLAVAESEDVPEEQEKEENKLDVDEEEPKALSTDNVGADTTSSQMPQQEKDTEEEASPSPPPETESTSDTRDLAPQEGQKSDASNSQEMEQPTQSEETTSEGQVIDQPVATSSKEQEQEAAKKEVSPSSEPLPLPEDLSESAPSVEDAPVTPVTTVAKAVTTSALPSQNVTSPTPITSPSSSKSKSAVSQQGLDNVASRKLNAELRKAQKEARTLRKHVVSLNQQLETAEAEMQAQRSELERAAERMEKDRVRHKEEREKEKNRTAEEMRALKAQHEATVKELKQRSEQQIQGVRQQLKNMEEQRKLEGGDWNKELKDAVNREQQMKEKLDLVEDEKSTLLAHISTLEAQQEALGNRLESLTHSSDNAMDRERDAEARLDEALSLHARQISQRQAREAELERTISELGSALVAARNKDGRPADPCPSTEQPAGDDPSQLSSLKAHTQTLEGEIENLQNQLAHEHERNDSLHKELREVSRERTEEAAVVQQRQIHHDRQVAELMQTISELKTDLRELKSVQLKDTATSDFGSSERDDLQQIKNLSEEVLRLREKVSSNNSEVSALKSRLQAALDRAKRAEAAAENAKNGDDVERSPESGMRRRGRGRPKESNAPSMRQALHLDVAPGDGTEKIGKSLDALDGFLSESGKFLRYNPLARLFFIFYLVLLHLWTFVLLFAHTHAFATVHGDFGAADSMPHGPAALMQQQAVFTKETVTAPEVKPVISSETP